MPTVTPPEPNDTFTQANAIVLGDTIVGSLESSSDRDYFKFALAAGDVIKLDIRSAPQSSSAYAVTVYDSAHNVLGANYQGRADSVTFTVAAQSAGIYYIGVGASTVYSSSPYTITTSLATGSATDYEHEPNDTLANATPVSFDHMITGQRSKAADADCFSLNATSGGTLVLDFIAPQKYNGPDYQVSIYDPSGNLIETRSTNGNMIMIEHVADAGKYFVRIEGANGRTYQGNDYHFQAHLEAGNVQANASLLSSSAVVNGTITSPSQQAWYKLNLKAGTPYEFILGGQASGLGTLATPSLSLCAFDGHSLEYSTNLPTYGDNGTLHTADPQIAFVAPYSGTYYLMVDGMGGIGNYTLQQKTDDLASLTTDLLRVVSGGYRHWASGADGVTNVTYGFLTATANSQAGFKPMNDSQKQAVRDTLTLYSSFANINFTEVSDPNAAQIRYGTSDQGDMSSGVTYVTYGASDGVLGSANVFISNASKDGTTAATDTLYKGGGGLATLIHETGHALGLKHPGDYDAIAGAGAPPFIPAAWDNHEFSIMSYIADPEAEVSVQSPGVLDIAAIQSLYGARTSSATQTLSFDNKAEFDQSIVAPRGPLVLDLSNQTVDCTISTTPGTLSSIGLKTDGTPAHDNLAIPFGSNVTQVIGGAGDDYMIGGEGDDKFSGGNGNDTLMAQAGNNVLDGGNGIDTVVEANARSEVTLARTSNGFVLTHTTGSQRTDTLSNIERVLFSDTALAFDIGGIAGQAYRLYQAAFDRKPDLPGLGYWIHYMEKGMSLAEVSSRFQASAEFQSLYGNSVSNAQLVTLLYQNVLHRAPEAAGFDYWIKILNSGQESHADILINFSESPENQTQVIGSIQNGIEYTAFG